MAFSIVTNEAGASVTFDQKPHARGGLETKRLTEVLVLLAFSLLLYVVTTSYDLVVDDPLLIVSNPYVRSFHYVREILTQHFWGFRGSLNQTSYYRPLIMMTLLVERAVFGLRPAAFHLWNVILSAVVVVLVYQVATRFWPQGQAALWAGLLFAAHPLHVENVAPISGLSDLMCAVFFLLAALVYTRPLDQQGLLPRRWAWAAALSFGLSAVAKEVALTLPMLLVVYEHFLRPNNRIPMRERALRYTPTLLVAGAYLVARLKILGGCGGFGGEGKSRLNVEAELLSALSLMGEYSYKLAWPLRLTYFKSFRPPETWLDPFVLLGVVVMALAALAFFHSWHGQRVISFAILWYLLTLGPVFNIHWLGAAPYGKRYLFIPSVAFCWLLGAGLESLRRQSTPVGLTRAVIPIVPLLLVGLATTRTAVRLRDWRNNFTLASAALRVDPHVAPAHIYLGVRSVQLGERERARQEFMTAVNEDHSLGEAYIDLANLYIEGGQTERARAVLERAAVASPHMPEVHYSLGLIALVQGRDGDARRFLERAVELNPYNAASLNNLGLLVLEGRESARAQSLLEQATRTDPSFAETHNNLGTIYARRGDLKEAEAEFRRAIEIPSPSDRPYLNLANLYEQQGNLAAAMDVYRGAVHVLPGSGNANFRLGVLALKLGYIQEATQAPGRTTERQPDSSLARTQLGLAYLAAGNRDAAKRELRTALRMNPGDAAAKSAARDLP